jgi:hypothetical protein
MDEMHEYIFFFFLASSRPERPVMIEDFHAISSLGILIISCPA